MISVARCSAARYSPIYHIRYLPAVQTGIVAQVLCLFIIILSNARHGHEQPLEYKFYTEFQANAPVHLPENRGTASLVKRTDHLKLAVI